MATPRQRISLPPACWRSALASRIRGDLWTGDDIGRLEAAFASFIGVPDAVAVPSGRAGLRFILESLDLEPGAEVICAAFGYPVVPHLVKSMGFTLRLVDCELTTLGMDPQALAEAITDRTAAVIATHLYGVPCRIDEIAKIAEAHGASLIEDCAHCGGASVDGRQAGAFGRLAYFSFETSKMINTLGGGMITTTDPAAGARVRELAAAQEGKTSSWLAKRLFKTTFEATVTSSLPFNLGVYPALRFAQPKDEAVADRFASGYHGDHVTMQGRMGRYTNYQAKLGLRQLERATPRLERRSAHARRLIARLEDLVTFQAPAHPGVIANYMLVTARFARMQEVAAALLKRGVDTKHHYMRDCSGLLEGEHHANAARAEAQVLHLPAFPELSEGRIDEIAEAVRVVVTELGEPPAADSDPSPDAAPKPVVVVPARAEPRGSNRVNDRREKLLVIVGLLGCAALLLLRLGVRALWDIDEGMHAATARDMVLTGDWIVPRVNGVDFFDKPPLFNWLTALSFVMLGYTEFAARLPAALCGLGGIAATWMLGRRMFGPLTALLGGVILATCVEYVILSRAVVHDICLTLFVTLTLALFWFGYEDETRRRRYFLLAWVTTALAVLAKGPVGFVVPAMVAGSFLIAKRRLSLVREMQIGWGVLIFVAIAAPWYVLISLREEDYAGHFFLTQNIGYFFSGESRHPRPFHYYIPVLFGGLFPWSCFLPMALLHALRERARHVSPAVLFLLLWFGVTFLFFSIAKSKLSTYILVLFPPAALLIACTWRDLLEAADRHLRRGFILSFTPLALLAAAAAVAVLIPSPAPTGDLAQFAPGAVRLTALVSAPVAIASFVLFLARRYAWSFVAVAMSVAVFFACFLTVVTPGMEPYRSTRVLAQQIDEMLPPGEPIHCYRKLRDSVLFYTDRNVTILHSPSELRQHLRSAEGAVAISSLKDIDEDDLRGDLHFVAELGNRAIVTRPPR